MVPRARTQMWGVPSRSCRMISAEAHSSLPTTAGLHGVRFQSLCLHPPATARFPVPVPHSRVAPSSLAKMVFCHLVFFGWSRDPQSGEFLNRSWFFWLDPRRYVPGICQSRTWYFLAPAPHHSTPSRKEGSQRSTSEFEIRTGCSCPACNQAEASGLCLLLQDCQPNSPRSGALRLKLNFSQGESSLELKSREVLFCCLLNALAETGHSPILIRLAA